MSKATEARKVRQQTAALAGFTRAECVTVERALRTFAAMMEPAAIYTTESSGEQFAPEDVTAMAEAFHAAVVGHDMGATATAEVDG